jgi:heme exporter protein D|tara:strand:- start:723 stop:935 length:213 start_codon:yes stop_codon:yes gene_type:complete
MNGYGFFVWFSFGIVIISCLVVYLKTRKTLKKYEKEFLMEIETLSASEKERIINNSKIAKQIIAASLKAN